MGKTGGSSDSVSWSTWSLAGLSISQTNQDIALMMSAVRGDCRLVRPAKGNSSKNQSLQDVLGKGFKQNGKKQKILFILTFMSKKCLRINSVRILARLIQERIDT